MRRMTWMLTCVGAQMTHRCAHPCTDVVGHGLCRSGPAHLPSSAVQPASRAGAGTGSRSQQCDERRIGRSGRSKHGRVSRVGVCQCHASREPWQQRREPRRGLCQRPQRRGACKRAHVHHHGSRCGPCWARPPRCQHRCAERALPRRPHGGRGGLVRWAAPTASTRVGEDVRGDSRRTLADAHGRAGVTRAGMAAGRPRTLCKGGAYCGSGAIRPRRTCSGPPAWPPVCNRGLTR